MSRKPAFLPELKYDYNIVTNDPIYSTYYVGFYDTHRRRWR